MTLSRRVSDVTTVGSGAWAPLKRTKTPDTVAVPGSWRGGAWLRATAAFALAATGLFFLAVSIRSLIPQQITMVLCDEDRAGGAAGGLMRVPGGRRIGTEPRSGIIPAVARVGEGGSAESPIDRAAALEVTDVSAPVSAQRMQAETLEEAVVDTLATVEAGAGARDAVALTDAAAAEGNVWAGISLPTRTRYSFKLYPPASLTYESSAPCVVGPEKAAIAEAEPLKQNVPVLFVIGAQKAGTTWLWGALHRHSAFVGAKDLETGADIKELEYFSDRLVTNATMFMDLFERHGPSRLRSDLAGHRKVLMDATPQYLKNPNAAPRIAKLVPHARIVVVMRDPIARAVSALKMYEWRDCLRYNLVPGGNCTARPAVADLLSADLAAIRADVAGDKECFYHDQDGSEAFKDCFCRRKYSIEKTLMISNYAPLLAWWLAFFPPERFLIVTSQQLREAGGRVKVLNRIVEHAGLIDAEPFTEALIAEEEGFQSRSGAGNPPGVDALVPEMRALFERPAAELVALVNEFWPEEGFTGLEDEM